jgi:hypothetical protein
MKKWILIGVFGIIGLVVLLAAVGWFVFSRPVDPNSAVGLGYAEGFKSSFVDSCLEQVNASPTKRCARSSRRPASAERKRAIRKSRISQ